MNLAHSLQSPVADFLADTDGSERRLLVVEPDEARQKQLRRIFAQSGPQWRLHFAVTARQAIGYSRVQRCDCVLLSDQLPDQPSLALVSLLKDADSLAQLPVIVLTDAHDEQLALMSLECGAVDLIAWDRLSGIRLESRVLGAIERRALTQAMERQRLDRELSCIEMARRQERLAASVDDVIHALRTPLGAMQEFVSLVLDGVTGRVTDEQGKYLALARGSCQTLEREIERLHEVLNLDCRLSDVQFDAVSLVDVVEFAHRELQLSARYARVSIALQYVDDLPDVRADRLQIAQVIVQLLSHTIALVGAGGQIIVELGRSKQERGHVCVGIRIGRCAPGIADIATSQTLDDRPAHFLEGVSFPGCTQILADHRTHLEIEHPNEGEGLITFALPVYGIAPRTLR